MRGGRYAHCTEALWRAGLPGIALDIRNCAPPAHLQGAAGRIAAAASPQASEMFCPSGATWKLTVRCRNFIVSWGAVHGVRSRSS